LSPPDTYKREIVAKCKQKPDRGTGSTDRISFRSKDANRAARTALEKQGCFQIRKDATRKHGRSREARMLSDSKGDAFEKQKQIMMPMGVG
jgi:hypothetical protein